MGLQSVKQFWEGTRISEGEMKIKTNRKFLGRWILEIASEALYDHCSLRGKYYAIKMTMNCGKPGKNEARNTKDRTVLKVGKKNRLVFWLRLSWGIDNLAWRVNE